MAATDNENEEEDDNDYDEENDNDHDDDSGTLPNISALIRKSVPTISTSTNSQTAKRAATSKKNSKSAAAGSSGAPVNADQGELRAGEAPSRTLLRLKLQSREGKPRELMSASASFPRRTAGRADAEAALQELHAQMRADRQADGDHPESDEDDNGEQRTVKNT